MKKRQTIISILAIVLCLLFLGCEAMAILFHGPRPEDPPVTYTVTFDGNGASGTAPAKQTVNAGTAISLPGKGGMDKAGDIFAGWNESSSGTGTTYAAGASVTVTENLFFYAQWLDSSTPQYTVTFNANGATTGAPPASQTVYSGISITVPSQGTLAYSGKKFGGWNTLSNGGGINYTAGTIYTVTGDTTLYAKWQSEIQYTVTYNANGGGTSPQAVTVDPQTVIKLASQGSMSSQGKTFTGWNTNANGSGTPYEAGAEYTVTGNITLYAQWESTPIIPQGQTFVEKLEYIRSAAGAGDGIVYDVVVDNNEYIGSQTVSTMGRNITVNIRSASSSDVKTIQLEGQGHLFSVDASITLKLQNIVLRGHSNNNRALVLVGSGGILTLNSGAIITGNISTDRYFGGGIRVNGGILEINEGAEITGNENANSGGARGGGIYVENRGTVTIRGGIISGNKIKNTSSGTGGGDRDSYQGGGIYITGNSTVTMSGGIISKNLKAWGTNETYATARGGGIYVVNGSTFTKRATQGSSTSGVIYGFTGDNANLADEGSAIYRDFGTRKQRNSTLGNYDEISSGNDVGWE
jgi:uncharacterized repeat protein (TIGR02543 family)